MSNCISHFLVPYFLTLHLNCNKYSAIFGGDKRSTIWKSLIVVAMSFEIINLYKGGVFLFRSIFSRAFLSHVLLVVMVCAALAYVFFRYTTSVIQNQVLETYQQLNRSASAQLDKVVSDMDMISLDILGSRSMIGQTTYNLFRNTGIAGYISSEYIRNLFLKSLILPIKQIWKYTILEWMIQ